MRSNTFLVFFCLAALALLVAVASSLPLSSPKQSPSDDESASLRLIDTESDEAAAGDSTTAATTTAADHPEDDDLEGPADAVALPPSATPATFAAGKEAMMQPRKDDDGDEVDEEQDDEAQDDDHDREDDEEDEEDEKDHDETAKDDHANVSAEIPIDVDYPRKDTDRLAPLVTSMDDEAADSNDRDVVVKRRGTDDQSATTSPSIAGSVSERGSGAEEKRTVSGKTVRHRDWSDKFAGAAQQSQAKQDRLREERMKVFRSASSSSDKVRDDQTKKLQTRAVGKGLADVIAKLRESMKDDED